ncbi:MAG: OmpA family protein [Bacteroidales bacterium]
MKQQFRMQILPDFFRNVIFAIICFFAIASIHAQQMDDVPFKRKYFPGKSSAELKAAEESFYQGQEIVETRQKRQKLDALPYLLSAQDFNPNNAELNLLLAECYLFSIDKKKAIPFLEKVLEIKTTPELYARAYRCFGDVCHLTYQFDKAIEYYKRYLEYDSSEQLHIQKKIAECNAAKELVNNPVPVVIHNVGQSVNSGYGEYSPVVNADGSVLYFTSNRPNAAEDFDEDLGAYFENIYVAYKNGGLWGRATDIGEPINSASNDAVVGISVDAEILLLFLPENGGDIGYALRNGMEWGRKISFGPNVNSPHFEGSASLSSDGSTLYFVSNRANPESPRKDIYYSKRGQNGEWQTPINIGTPVNSEFDESSVCIHPNGTTLFFSSNGHKTMGGYDIFRTDYVNGEWTVPENIGYPVNTPDDDMFFQITASNRFAFFSSVRADGLGDNDIYRVIFLGNNKQPLNTYEEKFIAYLQKPQGDAVVERKVEETSVAVTLLKGIVRDEQTQEPLLATIEVVDNMLGESVASFSTNASTGAYLVSLPSGKNYGIVVRADDYLFYSQNVDIRNEAEYQEIYKDIDLTKIAVGAKVVLRNIFFETGKSDLANESYLELARVGQMLVDNTKLRLEISGHTDNVGSAVSNKKLSEARAKTVVKFFVDNGIEPERVVPVGYGFDKPIASNKTANGRAQNRRTEFSILGLD